MNRNRIIFHIDLDAFFASCEERENPQFKGMPIVVGADPKNGKGRGVVSTANYKAREFGIHSAMPISYAWRLCPSAVFLPVNGALYSRVSKSIMSILENTASKYNGEFEQAGIDEAYLQLQNSDDRLSFVYAKKIAMGIKKEIYDEEKITASVGIGPNMLIAKIASDFRKPDGLTIVKPKDVQKFLGPLPIRKLPGIGPKTETELKRLFNSSGSDPDELNIKDLQKISQSILYDEFGQHGISIYESARGIDSRTIGERSETKSISEEHTFANDTSSAQEILPVLFSLVKKVIHTAKLANYQGFKTITLKIRYSDFKTHTKSLSNNYDLENLDQIEKIALQLFWPFIKDLGKNRKIRLIGFKISRFT